MESLEITNQYDTIGSRIRSIRERRNMTQKQLGELAGIAEPTIRRYELGKLNPKYETIKKIAHALDCSTGYLLDGKKRLFDKIQRWKSDKSVPFSLNLDSELYKFLESYAKENNRSLEDEIEIILHDEIESRLEDEMSETIIDVPGLTL